MHFKVLSAICFNFDLSKILPFGNGLRDPLFRYNTYSNINLIEPAFKDHLLLETTLVLLPVLPLGVLCVQVIRYLQ